MEFDGEDGIACHGTKEEGCVDGITKDKIASETTKKTSVDDKFQSYVDKLSKVMMSDES